MTQREYIKYHQEHKDKLGKPLNIGDTVVINNNHGRTPHVGTVSHYVESRRVAIAMKSRYNGTSYVWYAYRDSDTIVKLKSGRKKKK